MVVECCFSRYNCLPKGNYAHLLSLLFFSALWAPRVGERKKSQNSICKTRVIESAKKEFLLLHSSAPEDRASDQICRASQASLSLGDLFQLQSWAELRGSPGSAPQ